MQCEKFIVLWKFCFSYLWLLLGYGFLDIAPGGLDDGPHSVLLRVIEPPLWIGFPGIAPLPGCYSRPAGSLCGSASLKLLWVSLDVWVFVFLWVHSTPRFVRFQSPDIPIMCWVELSLSVSLRFSCGLEPLVLPRVHCVSLIPKVIHSISQPWVHCVTW